MAIIITILQAMARLSVKEAKLDELSDQLSTTEGLLEEAKKEIKFHRSNLTDEAKVIIRNRPNQEKLAPDWLISSHVTYIDKF